MVKKITLDGNNLTFVDDVQTTPRELDEIAFTLSNQTIAGLKTFTSDPVFSTGGVVTQINTVTLTNKRITPRIDTIVSDATPDPDSDTTDLFIITALAVAPTISAPLGTPTEGQFLEIRILDNGTGRALTWNAIYRGIVDTLPATTTANKTMYVGFQWNDEDSKWDMIALAEES